MNKQIVKALTELLSLDAEFSNLIENFGALVFNNLRYKGAVSAGAFFSLVLA